MADAEIRQLPAMRVLALETEGSIAGVSRAFSTLYRAAIEAAAPVGTPPLTVYADPPSQFDPGSVRYSACLPLTAELPVLPEGLNVLDLPETTAAVAVHAGPYERIGPVYERLLEWCRSEGYRVGTPVREVYVVGPDARGERSPADYRTEVQFPVVKA